MTKELEQLDKIKTRLQERNKQVIQARQMSEALPQLVGSLNELYAMLKDDFGMDEKEIQGLLSATN